MSPAVAMGRMVFLLTCRIVADGLLVVELHLFTAGLTKQCQFHDISLERTGEGGRASTCLKAFGLSVPAPLCDLIEIRPRYPMTRAECLLLFRENIFPCFFVTCKVSFKNIVDSLYDRSRNWNTKESKLFKDRKYF